MKKKRIAIYVTNNKQDYFTLELYVGLSYIPNKRQFTCEPILYILIEIPSCFITKIYGIS